MKSPSRSKNTGVLFAFRPAALTAAACVLMTAQFSHATTLYWDTNSTTAGSGAATGNWDGATALWSTDSTGVATPNVTATTAADDLVFSAGTNGTLGTVTVTGTQLANSISLSQATGGTVTFTGGTIAFGGSHATVAGNGIGATFNSTITGTNGLNVTGTNVNVGIGFGAANVGLSGTVNVSGVELSSTTANWAFGTGPIAVANGGGLSVNITGASLSNAISIAGTGILSRGALRLNHVSNISGDMTLTGNATIVSASAAAVGVSSIAGQIPTITGNVNLGSSTLTISGNNSTGYLKVAGTISGTGGLTGSSSLAILTGANTYTGSTTVSNGTSSTQPNMLQLGDGGITGSLSASSAITVTGPNAALAFNRSNTVTQGTDFASVIGGTSGSIIQFGTGNLILNGTNTYTGTTNVNRGTLTLDYATGTGNASKLADTSVLALGGGTLSLNGGSHTEVVGSTMLNAGSSRITQAVGTSTLRMNAITRNVGATVDFGAANIADTTTTNTNGILGGYATVGGTDWAVNSTNGANGAITALDSGSYTASTAGTTTPGATANVDFQASNTTSFDTQSINSLRFNTAAANTLTVTAASKLTNTTGGVLVTSAVGNNLTTITGGTIAGAAGKDLVIIQNNTAGGLTIGSVIADNTSATGLTKSGAGTLTITNTANTYTGKTYLNGGVTTIAADASLGAAPGAVVNDQLVFNGGTLQLASAFNLATNRGITLLAGGGTIDTNGFNSTYAGIITTFGSNGAAANPGGFTKTGAGTLTLSGNNSFNGTITVNGGTLKAGSTAAFGNSNLGGGAQDGHNALIIANVAGASVDIAGFNNSVGSLSGGGALGGNLTLGNNILSINGDNTAALVSYAGVISGGGQVIKNGPGSQEFSGANTYTGATTLNAGILRATTNAGALGAGALVITNGELQLANASGSNLSFGRNTTINGNAKITSDLTASGEGNTYTLGTLSIGAPTLTVAGGSNVTSGTAGLTFGATTLTGNAIFNVVNPTGGGTTLLTLGSVGGAGFGFTKTGAGQLTLSAANTYTGATNINGGTLQLGVANAIATGSAISLGGGTLNLGGFSQAAFTNALTLSASSTIDFGSHVGGLTLTFADSQTATWTGTLSLLNFTVGTDNLNFTSVSGGLTSNQLGQISLAGYTATGFDGSGNVQFTAVPEPSTYAAIFGGLALGGAILRRRRSAVKAV